MLPADLIATSARLLDAGLIGQSVIGCMVCHSVTCFSVALIYFNYAIVMHGLLKHTSIIYFKVPGHH